MLQIKIVSVLVCSRLNLQVALIDMLWSFSHASISTQILNYHSVVADNQRSEKLWSLKIYSEKI